ncbi:MAG: type II toxin-antitoxin system HicA family toxin [Gammaproteobacteria bacterium]|nr:type II toxin-antitoxin system HicA family toxin [Gammaproteobacteria bacterium]
MPPIPVLKARETIAILTTLGFEEVRQRGSHKRFRHADGRATTVPVHRGKDISPILLRSIARDVGLTVEDFVSRRR